jgi:hypothetical protein
MLRAVCIGKYLEPDSEAESYEEAINRLLGYVSPTKTTTPPDITVGGNTKEPQAITVDVTIEDHSCFLEGEILGKKVKFLVDTGASMSLISMSALAKLPGTHMLSATRTSCRTADGTAVKIHGVCLLEMTLQGVIFPLTLHVTDDTLTNTGILGLDHLLDFGATLNMSGACCTMKLSNGGQNVVRRLEAGSELEPQTLIVMSDTLLSPKAKDDKVTMVIPAAVKPGSYYIKLAKYTQKDFTELRLVNTVAVIGRNNLCLKLSVILSGDMDVSLPNLTRLANLYEFDKVRVLKGANYRQGRYQCLEDFRLPEPPKISTKQRAAIIAEQILAPHPDKIELTKEEKECLLEICTKYPCLWSLHPYEVRPANNIPAVMNLVEGAKPANSRPYKLTEWETVHLGKHIWMLLQGDIIERSTSCFNSPALIVLKSNPRQYLQPSEIPEASSITNSLAAIKELVLKKTAGDTSHMKGIWRSEVRIKRLFQRVWTPPEKPNAHALVPPDALAWTHLPPKHPGQLAAPTLPQLHQ